MNWQSGSYQMLFFYFFGSKRSNDETNREKAQKLHANGHLFARENNY